MPTNKQTAFLLYIIEIYIITFLSPTFKQEKKIQVWLVGSKSQPQTKQIHILDLKGVLIIQSFRSTH